MERVLKSILRWVTRIVIVKIVIAVAAGVWKRNEIKRLLAVNALFSKENILANFSHMDAIFFNTPA